MAIAPPPRSPSMPGGIRQWCLRHGTTRPGDLGVLVDEEQELLDVDEDGAAGEAAEQEDEGGTLQDHPHAQQVLAAVGLQGERAAVSSAALAARRCWMGRGPRGEWSGPDHPGDRPGRVWYFRGSTELPVMGLPPRDKLPSSVRCLGSISRCWKTPWLQDKCQHLLPTCDIKVSHAEDKP